MRDTRIHPCVRRERQYVSPGEQRLRRANPERSSSMSSIGGTASSLQSKRPRCAAGQRGGDAELQQAWRILGKPGGYDAPGEQELQDLADLATGSVASASRSAGSRPTGKRSSVWQQHSQQSRSRQGLPLLERCMVQPVSFNVPTYIDVKALRARLRPSAAAARDADFDEDGQLTGAEADDSWLTGHLRHMAQREREFTAWHAEHGAVALRVSFTRRVS